MCRRNYEASVKIGADETGKSKVAGLKCDDG